MADIFYILYFDNRPASREQLDLIEEIMVEQEIDMAWEARLMIPVCLDDQGNWQGEERDFMQSFRRIRVEVKVGDRPFAPLIDGPVASTENRRDSEPGRSSVTLVVHDDSVFLNREERVARFDEQADHEIAEQLFRQTTQIASTDIERTPRPPSSAQQSVVQRGTAIQILKALARRQGMHAYVLPGDQPGQSVGVFRSLPARPTGLRPLILNGQERNVSTFSVNDNSQRPARFRSSTLSIRDRTVTTRTSRLADIDLLGDQTGYQRESDTADQLLPAGLGESVDPDQAVSAEAGRSSYSFDATGSIIGSCYGSVLRPYQVVTVQGGNSRASGDYVISRVSHHLSRSFYSQEFGLRRNAVSQSESRVADAARGIF